MTEVALGVSREAALDEISRSAVIASRRKDSALPTIDVSLPYNDAFTGEADTDPVALFLNILEVHPELRRAGIGFRLMSAMTYMAIMDGYPVMHSAVDSPHSIRIFKKLFTETDVAFYDNDLSTGKMAELPLTMDQAISTLEMLRNKYGEEGDGAHSINFIINLGGVSLADLEEPVIVQ